MVYIFLYAFNFYNENNLIQIFNILDKLVTLLNENNVCEVNNGRASF